MAEKIETPLSSTVNDKTAPETDSARAFAAWRESLTDANEELKGFADQMAQLVDVMRTMQEMASAYASSTMAGASFAYGQALQAFGGAPYASSPGAPDERAGYQPNVLYGAAAALDPNQNELMRVTQELQHVNASLEGLAALLPGRLDQIDQHVGTLEKTWWDRTVEYGSAAGAVIAITQFLKSPVMQFMRGAFSGMGGAAAADAAAGFGMVEAAELGLTVEAAGAGLAGAALAPFIATIAAVGGAGYWFADMWKNGNTPEYQAARLSGPDVAAEYAMAGVAPPDAAEIARQDAERARARNAPSLMGAAAAMAATYELGAFFSAPSTLSGPPTLAGPAAESFARFNPLIPPAALAFMENARAVHEINQRTESLFTSPIFTDTQVMGQIMTHPVFRAIAAPHQGAAPGASAIAPLIPQVLEPIKPVNPTARAPHSQGPPAPITIDYHPTVTIMTQPGQNFDREVMGVLKKHAYEVARLVEDEQRRKARGDFN